MSFPQDKIRNFSIIAHIDHGKSTLADRILELTNSVSARDMEAQLLDDMELERERGITIKARAVSVIYNADDGDQYLFNLIDTPGHVDFNYEVSRSLAACEGAILVVDASQGIEAQTLANTYLAVDSGLEIVPVVNKIDLPSADPDRVITEIEDIIGIPAEDAPRISAKAGINIHDVLEKIVSDIPAPTGDVNAPLRALIFDSYYDSYKGVIIYVRLKEGQIHPGDEFKLMATGSVFNVVECGVMRATSMEKTDGLFAGEVGYISGSIKTLADAKVGDTVTLANNPAKEPLPGYREAQPMVFCGIYPVDGAKYGDLKDALEKLQLNDAALSFEAETSVALGFGFRCGFLGLLHMEIIQERLEREYLLDLITTAPSVIYRITRTDGTVEMIDNPTNYPDPSLIAMAEEPVTDAHIYTPKDYVGNIMELCQDRRGTFVDMQYIDADRVDLHYILPLAEIIYDFFDTLKSRTRGYASFDYELKDYVQSELVKLDIMLNGEVVDALWRRSSRRKSPDSSSRCRSRRASAERSSHARPSRQCARTSLPSATAATSPERKSCLKSRRRARSACVSSVPSRCRRRRSWRFSSSIQINLPRRSERHGNCRTAAKGHRRKQSHRIFRRSGREHRERHPRLPQRGRTV